MILFKISQLAKLLKISTKTLRLYEDLGLISPARRDAVNGYRYYSFESIYRISIILAYKDVGLTLNEIKERLNGTFVFSSYLAKLRTQQDMLEKKIERISQFTLSEKSYQARTFALPAVHCLSLELTCADEKKVAQGFTTLLETALNEGLSIQPHHCFFACFNDLQYKSYPADCTLYLPLAAEEKVPAYAVTLPARTAVCVLHRGDRHSLEAAYSYLAEHCACANLTPIGTPFEYYIEKSYNDEPGIIQLLLPVL